MVSPRSPGGMRREDEIRRKIMRLKKEGKIKKGKDPIEAELDADDEKASTSGDVNLEKLRRQRRAMRDNPVASAYADKIKDQLGGKKGRMMGVTSSSEDKEKPKRKGQLGRTDAGDSDQLQGGPVGYDSEQGVNVLNEEADLRYDDEDDEEGESDEDLVELVAQKMAEKRARELEEELQTLRAVAAEKKEQEKVGGGGKEDDPVAKALKYKQQADEQREGQSSDANEPQPKKTTTGIGGSWAKNTTAAAETRRPSRGSWGYFERPNDISKAYGGGRRVGAGQIDKEKMERSAEETRRKLQAYREKVGIEVQSEKDHAAEIEEALAIGQRAMERGMYGSAVSALEKVTKWCSSNSKVGGKVFLELAMAYEAVGRTKEAIAVYSTLTTCRIEEIKFNAKRLLYGIEAMEFMRNEAKSKAFSKKRVADPFIDATGLRNFAENFDDRYNTAWIDMDNGFYRKLTESVVRGIREARQILLQATGKGEVDRMKVVQALRSMSRYFDDALEKEMEENAPQPEPVALINGKPILQPKKPRTDLDADVASMEKFILAGPKQMMENLGGKWQLQLLADKRGDGVKYFNTTDSWQTLDTSAMQFESSGQEGFLSVTKSGGIEFNGEKRILTKTEVQSSGAGGLLSAVFSGSSGAKAAPNGPQQIVSVDEVLLITKYAGEKRSEESIRNYFCVWRRAGSPELYRGATP